MKQMEEKLKVCTKCKTEKALSEFHRSKANPDGLQYWCKVCLRAVMKVYRPDPVRLAANQRRYQEKHRDKILEYQRRYRAANREKLRRLNSLYDRRRRERDAIKVAARRAIRNEIRKCKDFRGPCLICGSRERVEAHHEDYLRPLDVMWLCKTHHLEMHREKRKNQAA